MCGLVGMCGTLTQQDHKMMKMMLYFDVLRGEDSTGLFALKLKNEGGYDWEIMKSLGQPDSLYKKYPNKFTDGVFSGFQYDVLMGHNRYATQGGVSEDTAHPFVFDNLIGAHNGTVNQASLTDFVGYKEFNVDSQIIYSQLNHDSDLQKMWDKADGAMALTWWDHRDKKIHIVRNKDRSLFYAFSKDRSTVYWASEAWMLSVSASRAGVKIQEVVSFSENTHYTFDPKYKEVQMTQDSLTPYSGPDYSNHYGMWRGRTHSPQKSLPPENPKTITVEINEYNKLGENDWDGKFFGTSVSGEDVCININGANTKDWWESINEKVKNGTPHFSFKETHSYILSGTNIRQVHAASLHHLPQYAKNLVAAFNGEKVAKSSIYQKVQCGCAICAEVPHWADYDKLDWVTPDMFVCPDCSLVYTTHLQNSNKA